MNKANKDKLINFFKNGEKDINNLSIGMEFEHIIVKKDSFETITYFEQNGIKTVLQNLLNMGWETKDNINEILCLHKNNNTITLEPGAQLELSIYKCKNIKDIESRYLSFVNDIIPILNKYNYCLMAIGYHPVSKVSEIPFIPKERYKYMSEYLKEKGELSYNMMKGTASLQVSIDYINEQDYIKKFRVSNYLSPYISLIFDNTPIFEGQVWEGNIARVHIWNNVDIDRSSLVPNVMANRNFGYRNYADYIFNSPPIISLNDEEYIFTKNKLISTIYKNKSIKMEEIEHLLSMYFPDVRTKNFIEIRMIDSVPYPYNIAAAALWKGLLYNEENLNNLYKESLQYDNKYIYDLKRKLISNKDPFFSEDFYNNIMKILEIGVRGLESNEKKYMLPLIELIEKKTNLSNEIKKKLEILNLRESIKINIVN